MWPKPPWREPTTTRSGTFRVVTTSSETDTFLMGLAGVLPAGASFPYDFGFVPSTLGDDGDPL